MSDPLQSPESIIKEFSDSVKDLKDFIVASKKRSLNDSQRKVIIKNNIGQLKLAYNALISHMTMESEARSKALFDSIPKLVDVINSINHTGSYELIWLELNALINSFAAALIALHAQGDIWSIQGSATLLVQIILGLPKIEHLPSLLQTSTEDPEYLDRWIVTFNCLQFSAAAYMGVIYAIKTVNLSDLIYWSNQSFFYLSLLDNYVDIYEWEKIASVLKKRADSFFRLTYTLCASFQNLVENSLTLIKILGTKWPSEISTYGIFEDRSLGGLLTLINHVIGINKKAMEKVNEIFKSGLWTINDNPMQANQIKEILEINKLYDYYLSYIESLKVVEPDFQKLKSLDKNETIINSLTNSITKNDWVLSYLEGQVGSRDNILNSPVANPYIDMVEQQLEITCLLVLCTNNYEYLEITFKKHDWLFTKSKTSQFCNLFIKKTLVELFLATKLMKNDLLEELYNQILTIQEILHHRPRDFSAFILLEYILGSLLEKKDIPTKDEILIRINKNGLINGGDYHLLNEFQEYVDYLIQALSGENLFFSEELLIRKTFFNITDSTTWLIPDFNMVFKNKLPIPLFYLPFNRYCDGIVNSNDSK